MPQEHTSEGWSLMRCLSTRRLPGCGEVGHVRRDCPTGPCVYCRKAGHMVKDCPTAPPLRNPPPETPAAMFYVPKSRRTLRDV